MVLLGSTSTQASCSSTSNWYKTPPNAERIARISPFCTIYIRKSFFHRHFFVIFLLQAERAKQETKSKDELVRRLEENFRAAESKLKAKEQMCLSLSEKVKEIGELDAQLVNEKRARQAAEASYRDQRTTMEKLAADTKLSMAKMSEKAAMDVKEAVKEALDSAAVSHTKEVNRLLQQIHELKQATEARMSAAQVPASNVASESPILASKVKLQTSFCFNRICGSHGFGQMEHPMNA